MFKKAVCIIMCLLFLIPVTACDSTEEAYIYFELPETPSTLDPQIAGEDAELIIIKNVFEGLLRKDSDGDIVCGAAESFDIDGLTYTFKIRENAKWSNGDELTAYDFEFGFRRAVDPETKAPFVSRLFSIKGAKEINNGQATTDTLAVNAVDSKTLTITLENSDNSFENTLTTSIAMPCNEEFFYGCAGKYGLFADNILSNGSYELKRWRKDPFGIRLYRNTEYNGEIFAKNAAVFLTCEDDETPLERLQKNSVDMAFIESAQKSEAESSGLKTEEFENICWVLTIGNEFSQNVRKSLSMLVGSEVYSSSLSEGYSAATSLFPNIFDAQTTSTGMTVYNPDAAKSIYFKEVSNFKDGKFPSDAVLYYYDDGYVKNVVTDIVGHWQRQLSAFVNIEAASDSDLLISQLTEQSYSMAIFPVRAESSQVAEYLKKFGINYNNESLESLQQKLLKSNNIVPLMFQNTTISYSQALSNFNFENGNGYIDFAFIIKDGG